MNVYILPREKKQFLTTYAIFFKAAFPKVHLTMSNCHSSGDNCLKVVLKLCESCVIKYIRPFPPQ